nr:MAG TPA: hypothetical protein [Caudoviricetes sp.]
MHLQAHILRRICVHVCRQLFEERRNSPRCLQCVFKYGIRIIFMY